MRRGPDFLCVGMQKAGTDWLYDALCKVDGFANYPIKEFHHFNSILGAKISDQDVCSARLRRQLKAARRNLSKTELLSVGNEIENYIASGFSDEKYLELFDAVGAGAVGDITPAYSTLNRSDVGQVLQLLSPLPVVLIIRHPVDRLWSAFNLHLRRNTKSSVFVQPRKMQRLIDEKATLSALTRFVEMRGTKLRSYPTKIHDVWSICGDNLMVVGFQQIVDEPNTVVTRVASRILGHSVDLQNDFHVRNKKQSHAKAKMSAEHRIFLFEVFGQELRVCKEVFPKIASDWATE